MEIYHYGRKKKIAWIVIILALLIGVAAYAFFSPLKEVKRADEAARIEAE